MAGKEYTTAPILVNADGHPIPQYLDITDTTDSPQGTFKPLTQLQVERPDVQNVQLTGRNVEEFYIVEQYEIRDSDIHSFNVNIPKYVRDFELIVTDTHYTGGGYNGSRRLRFSFGLGPRNEGRYGHIANDGIVYHWICDPQVNYSNMRRFTTELEPGYGRAHRIRQNVTFTQMMLYGKYIFYEDLEEVEGVDFDDKKQLLENLKRAILYSEHNVLFNLQIKDYEEGMTGSISVKFVGWV